VECGAGSTCSDLLLRSDKAGFACRRGGLKGRRCAWAGGVSRHWLDAVLICVDLGVSACYVLTSI
jgi:hypothetical protein